jgi:folate-binding protein YgfZ
MRPFELIRFSGDDAGDFLQGQLTQDVRTLERAGALLTAWCNPQGRVVAVMRLLDLGDALGLAAPAELAEALVRRFAMYRLRARVEIAIAADFCIAAAGADEDRAALAALDLLPPAEPLAVRRARGLTTLALGERDVELYGRAADFTSAGLVLRAPRSEEQWQQALIAAGIATLGPATSEKYTPHMLNLDRLGAVSFSKGCYTGQEIVARTEHLGRVKRRLARYRLEDGRAAPGDPVLHEGRESGEVVNAAGRDVLAMVPLELQRATLTVNGRAATPLEAPVS